MGTDSRPDCVLVDSCFAEHKQVEEAEFAAGCEDAIVSVTGSMKLMAGP